MNFLGQAFENDIVRALQAATQFICVTVKPHQNPALVKIGGFRCCTRVNEHLRSLNAVCFGADSVNPVSKAGKHLAAHFPAVQFDRGVRRPGTGHAGADFVDDISGHAPRMPRDGWGGKMAKFVAFLRGINVGGHRKVPMAELRAICPGSGVQSYIASGNLTFDAEDGDHAAVLTQRIKATFGFDVPVLVLGESQMRATLAGCPFPMDAGKLVHAYLCYDDPKLDEAGVAALRTATEQVAVIRRTVWLYAPDGIGQSKLAAKLERLIGAEATARNLNTMIKMVDMLDGSV